MGLTPITSMERGLLWAMKRLRVGWWGALEALNPPIAARTGRHMPETIAHSQFPRKVRPCPVF